MVFDIKLFQTFIGHILMDETLTIWLDGHTDVFRRLLHKFFRKGSDFGKIYCGKSAFVLTISRSL